MSEFAAYWSDLGHVPRRYVPPSKYFSGGIFNDLVPSSHTPSYEASGGTFRTYDWENKDWVLKSEGQRIWVKRHSGKDVFSRVGEALSRAEIHSRLWGSKGNVLIAWDSFPWIIGLVWADVKFPEDFTSGWPNLNKTLRSSEYPSLDQELDELQ